VVSLVSLSPVPPPPPTPCTQNPRVVVSVGGQSNPVQTGLLSYLGPALTGFLFPSSGDSSGGFSVAFTGTNLGGPTSNVTLYFSRPPSTARYACVVVVRVGLWRSLLPPLLRCAHRVARRSVACTCTPCCLLWLLGAGSQP
jgi:hypothetical protein